MEIYFRKTNQVRVLHIKEEKQVKDVLEELGLKVCECVVLRDSQIIIESVVVNDSDNLEIITSGSQG